jgi:hypothetical protein
LYFSALNNSMDQEGLRGGQLKVSDEQEQVGNLDQREQSHNCNARRASEVQFNAKDGLQCNAFAGEGRTSCSVLQLTIPASVCTHSTFPKSSFSQSSPSSVRYEYLHSNPSTLDSIILQLCIEEIRRRTAAIW